MADVMKLAHSLANDKDPFLGSIAIAEVRPIAQELIDTKIQLEFESKERALAVAMYDEMLEARDIFRRELEKALARRTIRTLIVFSVGFTIGCLLIAFV